MVHEKLDGGSPEFRVYEKPPDDFDPLDASRSELKRFGLPPKPDEKLQPAIYNFWRSFLRAPLSVRQPIFDKHIAGAERFQRPQPKLFNRGHFQTSPNWSGAYITSNGNSDFIQVVGRWNVPEIQPPDNRSRTALEHPGEGFVSSVWIGIDGQRTRPTSSLPQIGTSQAIIVNKDGSHQTEYAAWTQWWVKGDPAVWGDYHKSVPIANFDVSPGDQIDAMVWLEPSTADPTEFDAHFAIKNLTKNNIVTPFSIDHPPGIRPLGHSAAWIVERPTKVKSDLVYPLPKFSEVMFEGCIAAAIEDGSPNNQDLKSARYIRMVDFFDHPTRSALISRPERVDRNSLRVNYHEASTG